MHSLAKETLLGISDQVPRALYDIHSRIASNSLRDSTIKMKGNSCKLIHYPEISSKKPTYTLSVEYVRLSTASHTLHHSRSTQNVLSYIYHCQNLQKLQIEFMSPCSTFSRAHFFNMLKLQPLRYLDSLSLSIEMKFSIKYFPFDQMCQGLAKLINLKTLEFEIKASLSISSDFHLRISNSLRNLKKIQNLILKFYNWAGSDPFILNARSHILSGYNELRSLELDFYDIKSNRNKEFEHFSEELGKKITLKRLILLLKNSEVSFEALFKGISLLKSLKDLRLYFVNSISHRESDLQSLSQLLESCAGLVIFHLELYTEYFPDKQNLDLVSKSFQNLEKLNHLSFKIACLHIHENFAFYLFPDLLSNLKAIQTLNLDLRFTNNNEIIKKFYQVLKRLESLESLELKAISFLNLIKNGNLELLGEALKNLKKLTKLALNFFFMTPKLTEEEFSNFFDSVSSIESLEELRFSSFFSKEDLPQFFSKISSLPKLRSLSFSNESILIGEKTAEEMIACMMKITNLEEFKILIKNEDLVLPQSLVIIEQGLMKMSLLKSLSIGIRGAAKKNEEFLTEMKKLVHTLNLEKFKFNYEYQRAMTEKNSVLPDINFKSTEILVKNFENHRVAERNPC